MLTDIFAERYSDREIWKSFGEPEQRLLVQAFQLVSRDVVPYYDEGGKTREDAKARWTYAADLLKRELGVNELAPAGYWSTWGNSQQSWVPLSIYSVCQNFVSRQSPEGRSPDRFMKERLSFVELMFRSRHGEVQYANQQLAVDIQRIKVQQKRLAERASGMSIPGDPVAAAMARNAAFNEAFQRWIDELNERFRRAGAPLRYHNGFIQLSTDEAAEKEIEAPFWKAVAGDEWANVRQDMSEAIDLRDSGGRDPAFYATRALESAIKIISEKRKLTTGKENGAFNFIENLARGRVIGAWERESLQIIFKHLRNPLGHGPGSAEMPELAAHHTSWAIESCMSWVKSLVHRFQQLPVREPQFNDRTAPVPPAPLHRL